MKTRISIFIIGLIIALPIYAVEITQLPIFSIQETFLQKIVRCKLNIPCYFKPLLGTSVQTISGSTLISAYPAIQNANVNALNDGKIENSTTSVSSITTLSNLATAGSLVTVGTLTTGTLGAGFTPVNVARGGTGSTTLSLGQVLVGSSTNAIGTVNGFGSSGQLLTSQGIGISPIWTTVSTDPTQNYNWTGSYFGVKNFNASSTSANPITLNGVAYNTPSTQGATGTVLTDNGSGTLTWSSPDWIQRGEVVATSSVTGIEIVNIATSTDLRIIAMLPSYGGALTMQFNHDEGPNAGGQSYKDRQSINNGAWTINDSGGGPLAISALSTSTVYIIMDINNSSTTQKLIRYTLYGFTDGIPDQYVGIGSWNDRTHSINHVGLRIAASTMVAGSRMTIYGKKD